MRKLVKVTCNKCNASRKVGIVSGFNSEIIDWLDNNPDPLKAKIISARHRLDGEFGWECICGNNNLWTKQEKEYIKDQQNPSPKDISELKRKLVLRIDKSFSMEAV